ncbi:MAG: hypothetical protein H7230_03995 [Candidatus Parcubacteria bacterium]|nr:hypothetical protein [Candidatus Paceibacterota bacterium]
MATETLGQPTKKRGEIKKKRGRKERVSPNQLTASQTYLLLAQILNQAREKTSQEQLAAIQLMVTYIQAVNYWYVVFTWEQSDQLTEAVKPTTEKLNDTYIRTLLEKYIPILIEMVSTPKHRAKASNAPAKELPESPKPASERGDFSEMIQAIVEGIVASSPEVKGKFRQILQTLESQDYIFKNIVEFSKVENYEELDQFEDSEEPDQFEDSEDTKKSVKFENPDRHRQLAGVRYHMHLMALIELANSNLNDPDSQDAFNRIISKFNPEFAVTLRVKLVRYLYTGLRAAEPREILTCLLESIQSNNLQRRPKPESAASLAGATSKTGEGGTRKVDNPTPFKRSWEIKPLKLEEVNEALYPERSIIPEGTTMFELAISALARYLPLPKDQRLSVNNLLDCLMEEFENPELSFTIKNAIKDKIKKGELKKEEIIKLIVEDEEGAKQSKRLKRLEQSKRLKRLEQLKYPIKSIPQKQPK